jgi:viroplasmin and RNaseH domain-containing protein
MLKDKIEKKNQLKKDIKNNSSQPGLTHQTCDLSHEIGITL